MAVSVLARPPADSLSVHPIVIVPDPFRKKPVGCRYNKIYCSLSLLLMSECGLVARSVVPGDPGRPPIECGMEGGWAALSAVVSVAHAARSAGSDAETSSTLEPPRSIYLFRPARMPNGATRLVLSAVSASRRRSRQVNPGQGHGEAVGGAVLSTSMRPPFLRCLEALLTMRARHDRHMYAAAPSSLSLPRSIPLPLFSFSLSSSVQSPSPRRRPAAHRPFYDLGSVPFLSSVSSERDHKSRLSEEETEEGERRSEAAGTGHICRTDRASEQG